MGFALRDFWSSKFAWANVQSSAMIDYFSALPNQDAWAKAWANLPPPAPKDFERFLSFVTDSAPGLDGVIYSALRAGG
eukprot:475856-Karenia_brevis.AAC.1